MSAVLSRETVASNDEAARTLRRERASAGMRYAILISVGITLLTFTIYDLGFTIGLHAIVNPKS